MTDDMLGEEFSQREVISCEDYLWKNILGSSLRPVSKSGSWKSHWIEHNQGKADWPKICRVCNCHRAAEHGVFIVLADENESKEEYIVPMCEKHSDDTETMFFNLKRSTFVAPAKVD